jgi:hypothetical protein
MRRVHLVPHILIFIVVVVKSSPLIIVVFPLPATVDVGFLSIWEPVAVTVAKLRTAALTRLDMLTLRYTPFPYTHPVRNLTVVSMVTTEVSGLVTCRVINKVVAITITSKGISVILIELIVKVVAMASAVAVAMETKVVMAAVVKVTIVIDSFIFPIQISMTISFIFFVPATWVGIDILIDFFGVCLTGKVDTLRGCGH